MREFKINKYITLKLEEKDSNIYVNGVFFNQCKYLLLRIPKRKEDKMIPLSEIESIDEAAENLDHSLEDDYYIQKEIPPEVAYWGHCSNLQAWYENNYDTRLLHSNLAFPLLKKLTEVGDPLAKRVFKEEIAKRLETGFFSVVIYLWEEKYMDYLNREELFYSLLEDNDAEIILQLEKVLGIKLQLSFDIEFGDDNIVVIDFEKLENRRVNAIWISTPNLKKFFEPLTNLQDLERLAIVNTPISSLPESLGNLSGLYELYLENTQLTSLPESLGNLSELGKLDLANTPISSLPESLGNLSGLRDLYLANTQLTSLPESLGNLKWLRELDLANTPISSLPESFGNLKWLGKLDLSNNDLSKLPESFGNLSELGKLDLSNNDLSRLPESFGNLGQLKKLNLSNNGLTSLPESFGNLSELSELDLSNNQLTRLPESFGNLESLKKTDLRGNKSIRVPELLKIKINLILI